MKYRAALYKNLVIITSQTRIHWLQVKLAYFNNNNNNCCCLSNNTAPLVSAQAVKSTPTPATTPR